MIAFTIGNGKDRPQGRRHEVVDVAALGGALRRPALPREPLVSGAAAGRVAAATVGVRLLTLAQVAEMLTLPPRSVRVLMARGQLRTIGLTSRRKAVLEADLVGWIAARRAGSGT